MAYSKLLAKYSLDIADVEYEDKPTKRELPREWPRVTLDQYSKDARRDVARKTDPIADAYGPARQKLELELSKCTYGGTPTRAHVQRVRQAAAELWDIVAPSERFDVDVKAETGSTFSKARAEVKAYLRCVEKVLAATTEVIDTTMRDYQRTVAIDVARRDGYPWYTAILENPTMEDVYAMKAANQGTPEQRNDLLKKALQLQGKRDKAATFDFKTELSAALADPSIAAEAKASERARELGKEQGRKIAESKADWHALDAALAKATSANVVGTATVTPEAADAPATD